MEERVQQRQREWMLASRKWAAVSARVWVVTYWQLNGACRAIDFGTNHSCGLACRGGVSKCVTVQGTSMDTPSIIMRRHI